MRIKCEAFECEVSEYNIHEGMFWEIEINDLNVCRMIRKRALSNINESDNTRYDVEFEFRGTLRVVSVIITEVIIAGTICPVTLSSGDINI